MRLLIGSIMIFFGTLTAAGLLALGQPSGVEPGAPPSKALAAARSWQVLVFARNSVEPAPR